MQPQTIQVAHATLAMDGKGEDDVLQRSVGDGEFLLAVADGLSLNSGRTAAKVAVDVLRYIDPSGGARSVFQRFREALPGFGDDADSETTVTCGLLKVEERWGLPYLALDFFAIGDSPIWRVVRAPGKYPFQRYVVHGAPYPAETAKVYATVRPHHQNTIQGTVAFGRVEIAPGEVLVICTDGIPEREVFAKSQSNPAVSATNPNLCAWLFRHAPYTDSEFSAVLDAYAASELLYDDATIIAARIGGVSVTEDPVLSSSIEGAIEPIGETSVSSEDEAVSVSLATSDDSREAEKSTQASLNSPHRSKRLPGKRPPPTSRTKHKRRR